MLRSVVSSVLFSVLRGPNPALTTSSKLWLVHPNVRRKDPPNRESTHPESAILLYPPWCPGHSCTAANDHAKNTAKYCDNTEADVYPRACPWSKVHGTVCVHSPHRAHAQSPLTIHRHTLPTSAGLTSVPSLATITSTSTPYAIVSTGAARRLIRPCGKIQA